MGWNVHLYDRELMERRTAIQHEAEQRRVLAQLPHRHRSLGRHLVGTLGSMLVALGSRMERFERRGEPAWNRS
jgi:hypothetical protein